jgi:hypothetical protein
VSIVPHKQAVTSHDCLEGVRPVEQAFRVRFREDREEAASSAPFARSGGGGGLEEMTWPHSNVLSGALHETPHLSYPARCQHRTRRPEHHRCQPLSALTPSATTTTTITPPPTTAPPSEASPAPTNDSPPGLSCERYLLRAYHHVSLSPVRRRPGTLNHVARQLATTQYKGIRPRTKEQAFGDLSPCERQPRRSTLSGRPGNTT